MTDTESTTRGCVPCGTESLDECHGALLTEQDADADPELVPATPARTALISDTEAVDLLAQAWHRAGDDGWNGADAVDLVGRLLTVTGRLPA